MGAALAAFVLAARPALAASFTAGQETVLTVIAAGAAALAIAGGIWALSEQNVSAKLRRMLRVAGARTRAAVGERDALLGAAREALIVWGRDGAGPYSYGGGEALLESCLKGAQATELSAALDALSEHGAAFALSVQDAQERRVSVRGRAVGGMAAVWIEPETKAAAATDFRAILDALPVPVWLRDRTMSLVWGNRAFLAASGAADLEAATREQVALEKTERDLASSARTQGRQVEAKRYAIAAGQRRALAITEVPVDAGVVGTASDVTDVVAGEARLQQHIDAHTDTLDKLATAVVIFDREQKLSFYNRAFAKLWNLPEAWLDTHPGDGDILDRLREAGKLAEQRNYQTWKRERLALYQTARDHPSEELWHLPGGKTLRVVAQPHPFGGLTFLYEDVTERILLESSYNTLIKVQSATLNTLQEGVAVFGPDGRLKLHNAAFAKIWDLSDKDLTGEPHVRAIAAACADKFGDASVWEKLIQNIVSGANLQRDMGEIERGDRTILSLALAPLPDGATLATFADVTDRFRIEGVLRERAEALEAADRLKSDFIKHVSYELRTPLNTIVGFAELLSGEDFGPLNERQSAYMKDIVAASNTLTSLVSDILDLALVESGALRLELERID
ncbi:MAG TPA: PAS-domain containing protein, partial [Rhizomicrobium sp.]